MSTAKKPPKQKPYEGVYANIDFEEIYGPKEYREYPKAIVTDKRLGTTTVVQDATEEQSLRSRLQLAADNAPPPAPEYAPDPAKQILISRAYELGVPINQKWSVKKLTEVIDTAERELDELPAEEPHKPGTLPSATVGETLTTQPPVESLLNLTAQSSKLTLTKPLAASSASVDAEKQQLINRCNELGINSPGMNLWGLPRLRAAIAEAEIRN